MPGIKDLSILKKGEGKETLLTAQFARELIDALLPLFNIRVFDQDGTEYDVKYSGLNVAITLKPIGEATSTGGRIFRGLWAGGTAEYQEMWKVATGSYAGTYVCVNPEGTSLDPWSGVDWVMVAQSSAIGLWT